MLLYPIPTPATPGRLWGCAAIHSVPRLDCPDTARGYQVAPTRAACSVDQTVRALLTTTRRALCCLMVDPSMARLRLSRLSLQPLKLVPSTLCRAGATDLKNPRQGCCLDLA